VCRGFSFRSLGNGSGVLPGTSRWRRPSAQVDASGAVGVAFVVGKGAYAFGGEPVFGGFGEVETRSWCGHSSVMGDEDRERKGHRSLFLVGALVGAATSGIVVIMQAIISWSRKRDQARNSQRAHPMNAIQRPLLLALAADATDARHETDIRTQSFARTF
jgi:hypothetical protein